MRIIHCGVEIVEYIGTEYIRKHWGIEDAGILQVFSSLEEAKEYAEYIGEAVAN